MSSDFIFIPSSIAFYIVMAFLPILSMIIFIQRIPFIDNFLIQEKVDPVRDVLGKFIPGISDLVTQVNEALSFKGSTINTVGSIFAIILSMLVTT